MSEQKDFNINEISLADALKFVVDNRGKTVPTANEGIALIATNCISNDCLYPQKLNVRYVSQDIFDNWFRSHPQTGDIILTNKGSNNGEVCLVPETIDFCIAQDMVAMRANENKIYPLYLFAALRSKLVQKRIKYLNVDAVIPHFKKTDFNKLLIPLPERKLQEFIGKIYFDFSYKIENLRRQNETLEKIAQTLFKHWFIDFEFPNADGKPYKSSGGVMVASELGDIPEGWQIETLESEVEIQKGVSYKGEGLADSRTGIPMHNLKSVYEGGGYRHDGIKFYSGDYKERHICKTGDIIVPNTEQGEKHKLIGFPARIPRYFKDVSILTHHLFKVIPLKTSYFSRLYIYYLIESHITRKQILGYTNGTTVNMLSPDGLKKPLLVKPDESIIKNFTQVINPIWEKQENNFDQIQTLTKIRDLLLPKLMSGKIRVEE